MSRSSRGDGGGRLPQNRKPEPPAKQTTRKVRSYGFDDGGQRRCGRGVTLGCSGGNNKYENIPINQQTGRTGRVTIDIWSYRHRSYVGMTCHWIDPNTLERSSKALCCDRCMGRHTYNAIASEVVRIHELFGLTDHVRVHDPLGELGGVAEVDEVQRCNDFVCQCSLQAAAVASFRSPRGAVRACPPVSWIFTTQVMSTNSTRFWPHTFSRSVWTQRPRRAQEDVDETTLLPWAADLQNYVDVSAPTCQTAAFATSRPW